jgi:hypothetical protein
LAIDFKKFINQTVKRGDITYVFEPFLRLLDPGDIELILKRMGEGAVESEAFANAQEYLDFELDIHTPMEAISDFLETGLYSLRDPSNRSSDEQVFISTLNSKITDPRTCARLLSYRALLDVELKQILAEAKRLKPAWERSQKRDQLLNLELAILKIENFTWPALHNLCRLLSLDSRWPLVPSEYTLFVPPWQDKIALVDPIEMIISESIRNPSVIYRLTARDFERFLVRIFEGFGYEVQLTATTRDGGADLICLRRLVGNIPVKVAVEAKRYSPQNPVSVCLVRQFVGANALLRANKLVYVTTSRFTRDARTYAGAPELVNLLDLKELPDIMEWARDFVAEQHTVVL